MTDKVILVIDKPNACWECMLCGRGVKERFCIARIYQQGNTNDCDIKDVNKVESWCPLKHPLKEVSNDFYIYDTEYLFKNLDREIDLLKSAERFKEYMRNREE